MLTFADAFRRRWLQIIVYHSADSLYSALCGVSTSSFAPKGATLVSPGQGNASSASVAAALGMVSISPRALKGRNNVATDFVSPCQGLEVFVVGTQGDAASRRDYACPGLICFGPFRAGDNVSCFLCLRTRPSAK